MSESSGFDATAEARGSLRLVGPETASLRICDLDLNEVTRGVSEVNAELAPGIYRAIAEMPGSREERLVAIRPGEKVTVEDFQVQFDSATPLWKARSHHEYHVGAAEGLSGAVHQSHRQANSLIFVFARALTNQRPAELPYFQVWSQDDELVASFPESGEGSTDDGWIALSLAVDRGTYYIRSEEPTLGVRNQAVYVDDGATTQLFAPLEAAPLFADAVAYMRRGIRAFDAGADSQYEVIDAALRGITSGDVILPPDRLQEFLHGKFGNPLLGLIGGYVLHRQRDFQSLQMVAGNTLNLLPGSPDAKLLMMLAELAGRRLSDPGTEEVIRRYTFSEPPMLSVGTALLLRLAASNASLVVPGSYLANIAPRLVVGSAWTRWSGAAGVKQTEEQEVEQLVESSFVAGNWRLRSARGLAQQIGLPHSVVEGVLDRSDLFEERATKEGNKLYRRREDVSERKEKVLFPKMDIPTAAVDSLLLYQAETALLKLTERSLLESGLSQPQMMLLGMLYWDRRALVPRRLRNTLAVEAQSLTGLIDGLESKGLVKRLKHPTDRRKIRVQITAKGRQKYEEAAKHTDKTAETYFKALTAGEKSQLRAALLKLRGGAYPLLGLRHDAAYPPTG